jgi:hypothetical protein
MSQWISFFIILIRQISRWKIQTLMRRSKAEYWSNRRIFWQQYSSSHSLQYRRQFCRLLADRSNQLFDSTEIDLNRCKHECRFRYLTFNNWSVCRKSVSSQMSLRMRHLVSLHRWKISFSSIRRRSHLLFRWLFSVVFWRFCVLISLSFWFENSFQEFFRSFSSFLRSIFIQSSEVLRSNNSIHWMSAFDHTSTIDSRSCDSRIFSISSDQSSRHSTICLAMLQMLHELLSLWLAFVRFEDDFGILLEDFLLTSKIFSDSFHDWESSLFQTQMTNSSFATNSKNRMRIDHSAH